MRIGIGLFSYTQKIHCENYKLNDYIKKIKSLYILVYYINVRDSRI